MRRLIRTNTVVSAFLFVLFALAAINAQKTANASWTTDFSAEKSDLGPTGRNPYFILEPGYVLALTDGDEELIITVKNETRLIDGVQTRVVEERESKGGEVVEISRNFFAISRRTNSVYYFGEEVDIYKNGKIVKHAGAWLSGAGGAKFGGYMPGLPLVGARYYQEIAPEVAMDRAEIIGLSETLKTPAGEFKNCLKTEDGSQIETAKEFKFYAPGVGLIKEESLQLVRYGFEKPRDQ